MLTLGTASGGKFRPPNGGGEEELRKHEFLLCIQQGILQFLICSFSCLTTQSRHSLTLKTLPFCMPSPHIILSSVSPRYFSVRLKSLGMKSYIPTFPQPVFKPAVAKSHCLEPMDLRGVVSWTEPVT